MSSLVFKFNKGMNDAIDPINLIGDPKEAVQIAAKIINMKPDGKGNLTPIHALGMVSDTIFTDNIFSIYPWRCANKHKYNTTEYSYDADYYIAVKTTKAVYLFYRLNETTWGEYYLYTLSSTDMIQTASDSTQFVISDGFLETAAKRIFINTDGEITINDMGLRGGGLIGDIVGGSQSAIIPQDGGMAIPAGVIIHVTHADVNEFGDISTPYPIISMKVSPGLYEGELNSENRYVHTGVNGGAFVNIRLTLPIKNTGAIKKYVYFRFAPYGQGVTPMTSFLLGGIFDIPDKQTEMYVTLSRPPSAISPVYSNTVGASANDVIVSNGITVMGNVSTEIIPAVDVDKIWSIEMANQNSSNYVDQLFMVDLYDADHSPVGDDGNELAELDWDSEDITNFRLIDADMITPLPFEYYALDSDYTYHKKDGSLETVKTRRLVVFRLPLIPAYTTIKIFLVKKNIGFADTDWETYGGALIDPSTDREIDSVDFWNLTKPRNENTLIAYNNYLDPIMPLSGYLDNLASRYLVTTDPIAVLAGTSQALNIYSPLHNAFEKRCVHLKPKFMKSVTPGTMTWATSSLKQYPEGSISFWMNREDADVTNMTVIEILHALGNRGHGVQLTQALGGSYYTYTFTPFKNATIYHYESPVVFTEDANNNYDGNFFIFFSWKSTRTGTGEDGGYTEYNLTIIASKSLSNTGSMFDVKTESYHFAELTFFNTNADLYETWICENSSNLVVENYNWIRENDKYWMARILNLAGMMYDFRVEPIGISPCEEDMSTIGGNPCVMNMNVRFDLVTENEINKDGFIKFGINDIPNLNEVYLKEEIIRLAYFMSESSAGYQSNVFAFGGPDGNVYQIAISTDRASWQPLVFLQNMGLKHPHALVMAEDFILWMSNKGLWILDRDGARPFSTGRIQDIDFTHLFWSSKEKTVYMIGEVAYVKPGGSLPPVIYEYLTSGGVGGDDKIDTIGTAPPPFNMATTEGSEEFTAEWGMYYPEEVFYCEIDVSESNTFATFLPGYQAKRVAPKLDGNTKTEVNRLTAGTYYWRVRNVYNTAGYSAYCDTQTAVVTA